MVDEGKTSDRGIPFRPEELAVLEKWGATTECSHSGTEAIGDDRRF